MKNWLRYVFTILLVFAFTVLNGQIRPGYVFGLNLSTMTLKIDGKSYNPDMPPGFHFGVAFEVPVNYNFSVQPAILFSAKGANYSVDTLDYSISPVYIEVPVNALYSFGSDAFKVCLFTGPYFGVGIGGYKIEPGGEMKDIKWGPDDNDDLKSIDAGLNFGAGVNIRGLMISVQYGLGLVNISPLSGANSEIKNRVIGISFSAKSQGLRASFGK